MSEYFPNVITFQKEHVSALKEMSPVLLESKKPVGTVLAVFQSKETLECYKRMTQITESWDTSVYNFILNHYSSEFWENK
jgi:hypothetical protein